MAKGTIHSCMSSRSLITAPRTHSFKEKEIFGYIIAQNKLFPGARHTFVVDISYENMDDCANAVFKDFLGTRSSYARGLGHLVIPEPSPSLLSNRKFEHLREDNEKNKNDADFFKRKLETIMSDVEKMRTYFDECDKLKNCVTELESHKESQRETLGDA